MISAQRQVLHQVQVTTAENRELLIGPAVSDPRALEQLVEAINVAVAAGKERNWRDAHIVQLQAASEVLQ